MDKALTAPSPSLPEQVVRQAVVARGPRLACSSGRDKRAGAAGETERQCLAALADAVFKDKILLAGKKHR